MVIQEAGAAGLQCVQVFSRNPVGGKGRALPKAGSLKPLMDEAGIQMLCVHAPYFVNPASVDPEKAARARGALAQEMRRAKRLSAQYVVMHPGHWQAGSPREEAVAALQATITAMLSAPGRVLIENGAGQGRELGADFAELGQIFAALGKSRRVGLMLDTAHAMAAGYALSQRGDALRLIEVVDQHIGQQRITAIHLNDSWYPVGARRDRHTHLLQGYLGREALAEILRWADEQQCPLVLETPGRDALARHDDIALVRELARSLGVESRI